MSEELIVCSTVLVYEVLDCRQCLTRIYTLCLQNLFRNPIQEERQFFYKNFLLTCSGSSYEQIYKTGASSYSLINSLRKSIF